MEEMVHRGPSRQVVAGYGAVLRLRLLGHQPRGEDFRARGARGAPRGHRQGFVFGREVAGRVLYRQAVVGPEEPRVGAPHVHVHRGLFRAAAEEARLWEDGDAESRFLRTQSLRCTGVWRSLARSARWLVAVAVRSRACT